MRLWAAIATAGALLLMGAAKADDGVADLAQAGERERVLELIAAGADVNAAQANDTTALHWAAYQGDVELAAALLQAGAEPNVMNAYGAWPLGEAVKAVSVEIVRMLLESGADPDAPNEDGQTALMLAARSGEPALAELLLAHGTDVNARESWRGQTALMWAADSNSPDIVKVLVEAGADVNARAKWNDWERQVTNEPRAQYRPTGGMTPLLYAARVGCEECVRILLDGGADIDLPNPDGVTPLMTALENFQFDVAAILVEAGANPHLRDWWGRTGLYLAVDSNIYRGAVNIYDGAEIPPDPSIKHTGADIARMLLERGAEPNVQLTLHRPDRAGDGRRTDDALRTGATPLLRAAVDGDVECMRLLLEHGAEVDLPNAMGVTPLMVAAGLASTERDPRGDYRNPDTEWLQQRAIRSLEILVAAGADVNARVTDTTSWTARIARGSNMEGRQGQTAIYGAAGWGWTDVVRWLLEHGARTDIVDANGKTPLDAARGDAGGTPPSPNEETAALIASFNAGG